VRWVVTGATGMLGRDVVRTLQERGAEVRGLSRGELDVRDVHTCREAFVGADVVVNCAAWTAVDAAEQHPVEAFAVNASGAGNVAEAAASVGARTVHVSSDYVFDGTSDRPYGTHDATRPRTAYGRGKLAGEQAVLAQDPDALVVRTAWLYGEHGTCFPRTMVRLARERGVLRVVEDQVGQPTWTVDVARVLVDLVGTGAPAGVHHATSAGSTSWWGFAREVLRSAGLPGVEIVPVTSAEFPTPARRPAFSALDGAGLTAVGVDRIGDWRERWSVAVDHVLADPAPVA